MKTSITKLKSSLLLSLAVLSLPVMAKPVAQVIAVKGQVFVITPEGKTKSLKMNDHLEDKSEVMVGEDGDITLNDYYDATYHMVQGAHLKFFNKSVQLKQGKTWIQSLNARHPLALTTANGHVDFWKGEFITTFDQTNSKTQVLVVNGEVEVSNVLDKNMKYTVPGGSFTLIDPETENGLPRSPTKVGLESLNQSLAEFKSLPAKMHAKPTSSEAQRSIASVQEAPKGKIVFMTNGKVSETARVPASSEGMALSYFKKKVTIKKYPATPVPIRFYGVSQTRAASAVSHFVRVPASVKPLAAPSVPKIIGNEMNIDEDFSNSLRMEQASQPKHTKELENLINDLKSY